MAITTLAVSSTGVVTEVPGTIIDLINPTAPLADSASNMGRAALFLLLGLLLGR